MNKTKQFLLKMRNALGALFVITIVMVVPLFSFVELGHFFQEGSSRSAKALPALQARPADTGAGKPQLFEEPIITVTFDDGYLTTYTKAMPILQKYGIRSTQYVLSGTADNPTYMSWEQIANMQRAGHEIACHTIDHSELTGLDDTDLENQIKSCKKELTKRFGLIKNFAAPYGSQDARTQAVIAKYFTSQRNTIGDPKNGIDQYDVNLAKNFDRNNIIGVTVRSDTTIEDIQKLIDYAEANNGWLVLTYHQNDDHGSVYSLDTPQMDAQMKYLAGTDVRIVTLQDALDSLEVQTGEF
ncbi:MAG TPA: polysaccharide deacetylase family protein [Candidatus Limnocylindrales bacterium]|nr:polysaccharide deacetylase family protein [Candidatus Limnocylindrales bacterium]